MGKYLSSVTRQRDGTGSSTTSTRTTSPGPVAGVSLAGGTPDGHHLVARAVRVSGARLAHPAAGQSPGGRDAGAELSAASGRVRACAVAEVGVRFGRAARAHGVRVGGIWRLTRHGRVIAHEGAHAVAGFSTGRRGVGVRLNRNATGETVTRVPVHGLGGIVAPCPGYLGPSVFASAQRSVFRGRYRSSAVAGRSISRYYAALGPEFLRRHLGGLE